MSERDYDMIDSAALTAVRNLNDPARAAAELGDVRALVERGRTSPNAVKMLMTLAEKAEPVVPGAVAEVLDLLVSKMRYMRENVGRTSVRDVRIIAREIMRYPAYVANLEAKAIAMDQVEQQAERIVAGVGGTTQNIQINIDTAEQLRKMDEEADARKAAQAARPT